MWVQKADGRIYSQQALSLFIVKTCFALLSIHFLSKKLVLTQFDNKSIKSTSLFQKQLPVCRRQTLQERLHEKCSETELNSALPFHQ